MSIAEQQPLRVSVQGVTEKMLNTLEYFFHVNCDNYCEIVNDESAELSIIDLDAVGGEGMAGEHQEKTPEQPLIVLSFHDDKQIENAIFIQKPVNPELLMIAIETINKKIQSRQCLDEPAANNRYEEIVNHPEEKQLVKQIDDKADNQDNSDSSVDISAHARQKILAVESKVLVNKNEPANVERLTQVKVVAKEKNVVTGKDATAVKPQAAMPRKKQDERCYIGSAPDVDLDDPRQLVSAQYDPKDYFQHIIQQAFMKAVKHHKPVELTIPQGSLIVFPDAKPVLLNVKESRLRAFCALPISDETLTTSFIKQGSLQKYKNNLPTIALEQVLWKAAIWASRGRVPIATDLNKQVEFQHLPSISRSLLFPNALHIAAYWSEQPCSLIDTIKALQIPQRYVFVFYSASNAIGIASVKNGKTNAQVEPIRPKKMLNDNFLGRLFSHLPGAKRKR